MKLRILLAYQGVETIRELETSKLLIGRADGAQIPDLDLSPDPCVSRQHAQLLVRDGIIWLSDLGSRFGTQVNGREIRAQGEWRLWPEDTILMGESTLRVAMLPEGSPAGIASKPAPKPAIPASKPVAKAVVPTPAKPFGSEGKPVARAQSAAPAAPPAPAPELITEPLAKSPHADPPGQLSPSSPEQAPRVPTPKPPMPNPYPGPTLLTPKPILESAAAAPDLRILRMIDTNQRLALSQGEAASASERRLAMLLDLPMEFAAQTVQAQLFQTIMNRVVQALPAARRGALLLRDPQQNALLLKAYVSADEPAVSETLARRAIDEKRGFIWRLNQSGDISESVREFRMVSGMYAPLQWQDQVFGVICVDSPVATDPFQDGDLQFLIAIGQYAGLALAQQEDRLELRRSANLVDRLLTNFSPKVRAMLLEQARLGKLRPGGTKSEVTILFCDICGFTQCAAQMDAHDVVDMLNHYFEPLLGAIFRHDGSVDKFVGDGVLAVFGSPEADSQQHQKAVRAALAMQEGAAATSRLRALRHDPTCEVRIGIHCGEVFHGFVGVLDRLELTVIGDAVNRACRYCEAAGQGEVLLSPDVFQHVFNLIKAEKTAIQTKEGELPAYRLKALKG